MPKATPTPKKITTSMIKRLVFVPSGAGWGAGSAFALATFGGAGARGARSAVGGRVTCGGRGAITVASSVGGDKVGEDDRAELLTA